jgi:hypothetical protein
MFGFGMAADTTFTTTRRMGDLNLCRVIARLTRCLPGGSSVGLVAKANEEGESYC